MEEWKTIEYHPNYEVSSFGNIRRKDGKIISQWQLNNGYMQTQFNTKKKYQVHRLVAKAFIPGEFPGAVINHLDGVRDNNHYQNLEWCDQSRNIKHSYDSGRHSKKGVRHHMALFSEIEVLEIRCSRESGKTYGEIAKCYGVKYGTIAAICRRENWKHI